MANGLVIRKAVVVGSATDQLMTHDDGTPAKQGPNGAPLTAKVTQADPPSGGISVSVKDKYGAIILDAAGVMSDDSDNYGTFGIDAFIGNGCAGPLYVTADGDCTVIVQVNE